MRLILGFLLALSLHAQMPQGGGSGGGSGAAGAANLSCTFAGGATSCGPVTVTSLNLAANTKLLLNCFTGASTTQTPLTVTTYTYTTGSGIVATVTANFSAAGAAGYCAVNATGNAGPQGAAGATGSTGPAGANGANGTNGVDGAPGANGTNGVDGAGNNTTCKDASGSTTTYTCVTPSPHINTLTGLTVVFIPQTTNSGASTLNIQGLGAKSLVATDGTTAMTAGLLVGGSTYIFSYDTTLGVLRQASSSGASGVLNLSTGTVDPTGNCTAPSVTNKTEYVRTDTNEAWICSNTNAWKKVLSTTNTGTGTIIMSTGTAPTTPVAGTISCYADTTATNFLCLDATGTNVYALVLSAATRTANQFMTHVNALGVPQYAQPTDADLAFTDVTINNVDITKHGFVPKAPNDATKFLNGTGAFSTPAGAGDVSTTGTNTYGAAAVNDSRAAAHTMPVKTGLIASLPATCTIGEEYFATNAVAGQNKYYCAATNTWTQQLNSGGGGNGYTLSIQVTTNNTFACGTSLFFGSAVNSAGTADTNTNIFRTVVPKAGTLKAVAFSVYNPTSVTTPAANGTVAYILGPSTTTPTVLSSSVTWPLINVNYTVVYSGLAAVLNEGDLLGAKVIGSTCASGALTNPFMRMIFYIE